MILLYFKKKKTSENSNFRTTGSNSSGSSGYGGKPTSSSPSTAQKEKYEILVLVCSYFYCWGSEKKKLETERVFLSFCHLFDFFYFIDSRTIEDNATTTSITNAVDSAYSHSNSRFQSR